jgi:hypothetical protein
MTATQLRAHEDTLFAEWKTTTAHEHRNFIADGVVHSETYIEITPKVMFLAREAHWDDEKLDNDMRPYLSEGVNWRSWQLIARWTRVLTTAEQVPWTDADDEANTQGFK